MRRVKSPDTYSLGYRLLSDPQTTWKLPTQSMLSVFLQKTFLMMLNTGSIVGGGSVAGGAVETDDATTVGVVVVVVVPPLLG